MLGTLKITLGVAVVVPHGAALVRLRNASNYMIPSPQWGFVFVARLIPVSAWQQVSELSSVSCLLAFLLQIIQQLPKYKHPESTDMGVHRSSWVRLGPKLGPSRGLIGAKSEG